MEGGRRRWGQGTTSSSTSSTSPSTSSPFLPAGPSPAGGARTHASAPAMAMPALAAADEPLLEAFAVVGLGPEGSRLREVGARKGAAEGFRGFDRAYQAGGLECLPSAAREALPPQLALCCLPAGVRVLPAGAPEIPATEGYPLVLTRGDGSKLYVSCLAFYDPVPPALTIAEPALQVGSLRHGQASSSRL